MTRSESQVDVNIRAMSQLAGNEQLISHISTPNFATRYVFFLCLSGSQGLINTTIDVVVVANSNEPAAGYVMLLQASGANAKPDPLRLAFLLRAKSGH